VLCATAGDSGLAAGDLWNYAACHGPRRGTARHTLNDADEADCRGIHAAIEYSNLLKFRVEKEGMRRSRGIGKRHLRPIVGKEISLTDGRQSARGGDGGRVVWKIVLMVEAEEMGITNLHEFTRIFTNTKIASSAFSFRTAHSPENSIVTTSETQRTRRRKFSFFFSGRLDFLKLREFSIESENGGEGDNPRNCSLG